MKLYTDLVRLHKFIEGRLSSFPTCKVIPAGDLLAAKRGATPSEVLSAYSSWGAVHGNGGSYTRMALTLVDKVLRGNFKLQAPQTSASEGGSKRKRAESTSLANSDKSSSDASRATTASTGSRTSSAAAHAADPAAAREGPNPVTRAIGTASLTIQGPLAATAATSMATAPLAAPPAAAQAAAAATAAATNVPDIFILHASTIVYCKLSCR